MEGQMEGTAVKLKDIVDILRNQDESFEGLTTAWIRSQLRKGNEILVNVFSQGSTGRWEPDLPQEDVLTVVAEAWTNRRRRGRGGDEVEGEGDEAETEEFESEEEDQSGVSVYPVEDDDEDMTWEDGDDTE